VRTFREALDIALVDGEHCSLPTTPTGSTRPCIPTRPRSAEVPGQRRDIGDPSTGPLGGRELGELRVAARQSTHDGVTIVPRMPAPPGGLPIARRDRVRLLCCYGQADQHRAEA
jgi:hypothetical protein